MKIILLSDLHLLWDKPVGRLDDTKTTQYNKLKYVLDFACGNSRAILQAGDFFDGPRSWRAMVMYIDLLKQYFKIPRWGFGCSINAIFGQHDTYLYHTATRNATALGVLHSAELLNVLSEEPTVWIDENQKSTQNIHIYGVSYGQSVPKVVDEKALNILVIHKMVVGTKLWPNQKDYISAPVFLKNNPDYHLILCGDAHQKFLFKDGNRIICNTGPLLRKEASEEMLSHKPGFYEYDTNSKKIVWYEIPHQPAEKVLTRNHIDGVGMRDKLIDKFISTINSERAWLQGVTGGNVNSERIIGTDFKSNLIEFLKTNKIGTDVKEIISKVMAGDI